MSSFGESTWIQFSDARTALLLRLLGTHFFTAEGEGGAGGQFESSVRDASFSQQPGAPETVWTRVPSGPRLKSGAYSGGAFHALFHFPDGPGMLVMSHFVMGQFRGICGQASSIVPFCVA